MKILTMPQELQKFKPYYNCENFMPIKKSFSEPEISLEMINSKPEINAKDVSQINDSSRCLNKNNSLQLKELSCIHYIWKTFKRIKTNGTQFFFHKMMFIKIIVLCFLIMLIELQTFVNQYLFCNIDTSNIFVIIYITTREVILFIFYYIFATVSFLFVFFNLPFEYYRLFIVNSFIVLLLKIYGVDPIPNYLNLHALNVFSGCIIGAIYYKKRGIPFKKMLPPLKLITASVFNVALDYFIVKIIMIPEFKRAALKIENQTIANIIFQIFLFTYFVFHYKFYFYFLQKYSELSDNRIAIFVKYYLIEAVSSSISAAVCVDLNFLDAWLGVINFLYQLLVLHDGRFNFFYQIKLLIFKILKIKPAAQQTKIAHMINESLFEMNITIYINLILWYWKKRCLTKYILVETCDFQIFNFVQIRLENIFVLFGFNLALIVGFFFHKKEYKLVWIEEPYGFFFQIYYNIMIHIVVDLNLQFFIGFFYLDKITFSGFNCHY